MLNFLDGCVDGIQYNPHVKFDIRKKSESENIYCAISSPNFFGGGHYGSLHFYDIGWLICWRVALHNTNIMDMEVYVVEKGKHIEYQNIQ